MQKAVCFLWTKSGVQVLVLFTNLIQQEQLKVTPWVQITIGFLSKWAFSEYFFSLIEYIFRTNMLYKGLTIYKAELLMRFVVVHSTVIDEINMAFG